MSADKEVEMISLPKSHVEELEEKARDCDYYKGRVDGLEYVIDTLENILKGVAEFMTG